VRLSRPKKPTSPRPLRVLIVEDSEDDTLLLLRELKRGGYEPNYKRVETAEAMEKALADSEWDVIISDYRMPRFSALEALKVFKKSGSDAPFIVVSGQVGEEAAVEVMKAGAYDFLTKGNLAFNFITKGYMPLLCPTVDRGLEEAKERRERQRADEELRRRDAVLDAVRFAAERFLGGTAGWEENVRSVLRRLGEAAAASRVYIFENYKGEDGELWATQRYEWVAPGVSAQIDNPILEALPFRAAGFGRWVEVLGRGDLVYGHTREFPESEQPELRSEDILSIVVVPIFVEEEWWGFVGFDECLAEREWSDAEMDALKAAASTLGAALRRRRVEQALRESEERYSLVVEGSNDGIFDWDIRTGNLYWNDRLYEMLSLSRSGFCSSFELFVELLHPEDRQRVLDAIAAHIERGVKYSEEFRLRNSSGDYVYCISRGMAQRDESGTPVRMAGAVTDITERKRSEAKLRASEAELRALFESMTDLIFVFDSMGRYLKVAPTNPSLLYRPSGETLGRTLHEVLPREQADGILSNIRRALESQQSVSHEYDLQIGDRKMWFEATISPMLEDSVVAVVRDVTERKRSEEALRESERLYRTVIEQVTEYICLVDVETRYIVASNPAFRAAHGYSAEELRRMTLYDIVAHGKESIDRHVERVLEEGRGLVGDRKYRRKDGSLVDVEVSLSTILRDGRETLCVVAHDVTKRAQVQELLEERVATLSSVASSVALELPMEDILDALAEGVVSASTAVACSLVLADEGADSLYPVGSYGLPEGYAASLQEVFRSEVQSPTLEAARTRQPVLVRDVRRYILTRPGYAPIHRFVREVPWDTVYIVPLVSRGRALGAINLRYLRGQEPGEDERSFLKAVADQAAVAVENARLFAQARGKAALEERQRLARELHDSVSQALYGIALGAKTARTVLEQNPQRAADPLEYVLSLAEAGLAEMRALIFELRPESLEQEGLVTALQKQAAALRARHEIAVEALLCEEPEASPEAKEAVYRIAQEALHNTVKHARANRAEIRMKCEPGWIDLEVSDDGVGFDAGSDFPGHLGLRSMRERAEQLGGTLQVETEPGSGTTIHVRIPAQRMEVLTSDG
jgi:PAS domain S-box-containing protein